jgi:hypothetical protein
MKYLLLLLLPALLFALGCSKKEDATPHTVVSVHYAAGGSAMQYLGRIDVGNIDHADTHPGNYFSALVTTPTLEGTREILTDPLAYFDNYDLTVKVYMRAAERGTTATYPMPPGTFVQAEILVNGQVRKTARVDETT